MIKQPELCSEGQVLGICSISSTQVRPKHGAVNATASVNFFFFFLPYCMACRILMPRAGIEFICPAVAEELMLLNCGVGEDS